METAELQDKIFAFVQVAKGKKKLKEKDIINGMSAETGIDKDVVKKAMRGMIDVGRPMYSYVGGNSKRRVSQGKRTYKVNPAV